MFRSLLLTAAALSFGSLAHANSPVYELTITNGSNMPISPGVVYIDQGHSNAAEFGQMASPGLIALCQTGNPATKLSELKASKVAFVTQTPGPILPGKSVTVQVQMPSNKMQNLHFEAMYGKSKEACATFAIPALAFEHAESAGMISGRDEVIVAGAFTQPEIPMMLTNQGVCDKASSAVDCLRLLSSPNPNGCIASFPGYLPSVLSYLESRYGAADVQTLLIPGGGAVNYSLRAK